MGMEITKKIVLSRKDIYSGDLILVKKGHPIRRPEKEVEDSLVCFNEKYKSIRLRRNAAVMLEQLIKACGGEGQIVPVSGFRSVKEQEEIYFSSLMENGREFTSKYVACPNESEHQTGLAIDLADNREDIDFLCPAFPYDGVCNVFRELAPDYGYIQRYEEGKEGITGIFHEPWHFRYVGYPHSAFIAANRMTLEEYIDYIKSFTRDGEHLLFENADKIIDVYYCRAVDSMGLTDDCAAAIITVPENTPYQISGNNVDGFIVTLWRNKS